MKKKTFLNPGAKNEILNLLTERQLLHSEIAVQYNVAPSTISKIARDNGIYKKKEQQRNRMAIKASQPEAKISLLSEGSLKDSLEEAYSLCDSKVQYWEKVKNEACKKLDRYRKKRSEISVALTAITRAEEVNNN